MRTKVQRAVAGIATLALVGAAAVVMRITLDGGSQAASDGLPLAVLGDSDSHSYRDTRSFPLGSELRGGTLRSSTFQWTEVLHALRGSELDQGAWGVRGHHPRIARVAGWLGITVRAPRKMDFAYNFAESGARCGALNRTVGQVPQLLPVLARDSARWARGAVVIRIGINDLGRRELLDRVAVEGAAAVGAEMRDCAEHITEAVRRIRAVHSGVHIVLVGVADNANWPPNHALWQTATAQQHLAEYHEAFDASLRRLADSGPRISFIDDRAWFRSLWGGRGPDGLPNYRSVCVGNQIVTNSQGDALQHGTLQDGHAGTVANALWARALTLHLRDIAALPVTPISSEELDDWIERLHSTGSPASLAMVLRNDSEVPAQMVLPSESRRSC
jgi:hypothetical protein